MCLVYKMIRLFYVSCALVLLMTGPAVGQATPYIGYAFPAGGQQGTTVQVRLGGQRIDGVTGAVVSGQGVTARLASYQRQLSNQEIRILRDQLAELKPPARQCAAKGKSAGKGAKRQTAALKPAQQKLIARIEQRIKTWVNRPASVALASIAVVDVAIAADAQPGPRELRLVTSQGVTNPLVFYVGQVPEVMRKPLPISQLQVLGKEALALQKRPAEEIEEQIDVPSTTNGQISSGKVNRYRFRATQGQKLVMTVKARELVPYIADAVPGWFQPVLTLCDADGNEVAFSDDYRFMPDPTLFFEVPENGEYVLSIYDAIYRGREDFVYRITIGELPFVTSLFPLGGRLGRPLEVVAEGWNLSAGELVQPVDTAREGIEWVTVTQDSLVSNRLPVQITRLPEGFDAESNNDLQGAQKVQAADRRQRTNRSTRRLGCL